MPLIPSTKLGPYEILAPLGAGGMGEIYGAKDIRLDRLVAIKVLPSHLSSNPEVRQRFEEGSRFLISDAVGPSTPPNLNIIVSWRPPKK